MVVSTNVLTALVDTNVLLADARNEKGLKTRLLRYRNEISKGYVKPIVTVPILMELLYVLRKDIFWEMYGNSNNKNIVYSDDKYFKDILKDLNTKSLNDFTDFEIKLKSNNMFLPDKINMDLGMSTTFISSAVQVFVTPIPFIILML